MPFASWHEVTRELAESLEQLRDGDFLILGEPVSQVLVRRSLFARRAKPAPTRYVQVLRVDEVLSAECVGAAALGGAWAMTAETIETLRALGWRTPEESLAEWDHPTPNFDLFVDLEDQVALVDVLVVSLQLLHVQPGDLCLVTSPSTRAAQG